MHGNNITETLSMQHIKASQVAEVPSSSLPPLPHHLAGRALCELHEKAEWRSGDIDALRQLVRGEEGLHACLDDKFLLRFLRARKFDYDRSLRLLTSYYRARLDHPDIFGDLLPSVVTQTLLDGVVAVLPGRVRGCKVLVLRVSPWDPDHVSGLDLIRLLFLTLEQLVEDEETQVCGIIVIADFTGFTIRHMRQLGPTFLKRVVSTLQDAFPLRLKAIHFVREPTLLPFLFGLVRPFIKPKILDRLYFHGQHVQELVDHISPHLLPVELGGLVEQVEWRWWKHLLVAQEATFIQLLSYGYNMRDEYIEAATTTQGGEERRNSDIENFALGAYRKLICTSYGEEL